jgi:hypothetical protein
LCGRRISTTVFPGADPSQWLDLLESFGEVERRVSICLVAGERVEFDGDELNGALRRALVVRAVGGDPHRELALDEDAVVRLADELASDVRKEQLQLGLASIRHLGKGRPAVEESIVVLVADPELAWHAFCAARLADQLAEER